MFSVMFHNEVARLAISKARLKDYCAMKLQEDDFHAVADAAMDLRELQAKIEVYVKLDNEENVRSSAGTRADKS